jgi:hypothetical protein
VVLEREEVNKKGKEAGKEEGVTPMCPRTKGEHLIRGEGYLKCS